MQFSQIRFCYYKEKTRHTYQSVARLFFGGTSMKYKFTFSGICSNYTTSL